MAKIDENSIAKLKALFQDNEKALGSNFSQLIDFFNDNKVTDNGDGTFSVGNTIINVNDIVQEPEIRSMILSQLKASTDLVIKEQLDTKADDSKVVHNSGNEEISGQKTFDTAPIDKATGNPYITKSGVPTVDLSSYATNSQLATKADDSKVVHSTDMRKPASDVAGIEEVNAKADTSAIDPSVMAKRVLTANDDVLALDPGTYYTWSKTPKNYPTSIIPWGVVVVKNISLDGNNKLVEVFDTYNNHFVNICQGNPVKWSGWQVPNAGTMASKSDVTTAISAATANKQDKIGYTPADDSKVVHDNHDGTEQLNGVKVQPFNTLSDSVGGRNLLPGTSGTLQTVTNAYGWATNLPVITPVMTTIDSDTTYTARAWISPASYNTVFQIAWKDARGTQQLGSGNVISAGTSGYSTWTGTITAGSTIQHVIILFNTSQSTPSSVSYKEMKLEKGSVATDWTPAPEDKVNVTDTANWQKNKVTNDNGSPLINLTSSNQDLSATLMSFGSGFHTFYASSSVQNSPFSSVSSAKGVIDIQSNVTGSNALGEGFLIGTKPNQGILMYHVLLDGSKAYYTQIANDSAVVHNSGNEEIGGQKTFDTAPIDKTTGSPYITKSDLPSDNNTVVKVVTQAQYDSLADKSGLYVIQG